MTDSPEQPPPPDPLTHLSAEERAAARRAEFFNTHKHHGSLEVYYMFYPDERPPRSLEFFEDKNPDKDLTRAR
jgi:hypothetical protein